MLCWVPDQRHAYAEAEVAEVRGENVTVTVIDVGGGAAARTTHNVGDLLTRTRDGRSMADMDQLPDLNEASVLNNITQLYYRSTIYSSVGPVLIAMNPFAVLPDLFSQELKQAYKALGMARAQGDGSLRLSVSSPIAGRKSLAAKAPLGPHAYDTAERAYQGLRHNRNQAVVICGESGAGKSVTNRYMLEYLCEGARASVGASAKARASVGAAADPRKITEANILLESFGNAKTVRNDNSSRFGKFTKLMFDAEQYTISGCAIDHYLLERSRVSAQPAGERNYHIFYQLLRSDHASRFALSGGPEDFKYTEVGARLTGFQDVEDFDRLLEAMTVVGMDLQEREAIFSGIAATLHLGNVEMTGDRDKSGVDPASRPSLEAACQLLGVDPDALSLALTVRFIKAPGAQPVMKTISESAARASRDAVAKVIYSRIFDHIINSINEKLSWKKGPQHKSGGEEAVVGLLDIFGFEDMPVNGFEQVFINLTNERIQMLFNSHMFSRELEQYRREGVPDIFEAGPSNQGCIDLFTSVGRSPGIVKLLADQGMQKNNDGSDKDGAEFVTVLNKAFKDHDFFRVCDPGGVTRLQKAKAARWKAQKPPSVDYRACFQIMHYTGPVIYTVQEFVAKSRDSLHEHLTAVFWDSSREAVKALFSGGSASESFGRRGSVREATVGEKFSRELEVLAERLERGECFFVRCIKPNPEMKPFTVDKPLVLSQLLSGGVIAALEMRRAGFPERMEFTDFIYEYAPVRLEDAITKKSGPKRRAESLLAEFFPGSHQYALGSSKVFMKGGVLSFLDGLIGIRKLHFANLLRRRWRIKMGTLLMRTIEDVSRRIDLALEAAVAEKVADFRTVAPALRGAKTAADRAKAELEGARQACGNDHSKIGQLLQGVKLADLREQADRSEMAVEEGKERRGAAEREFARQLDKARQRCQDLLERVNAVEQCIPESGPKEEWAECLTACVDARKRLERLLVQILEFQRSGPPQEMLEMDPASPDDISRQSLDPKSEAGAMLLGAAHLVATAEEKLEKVRALRQGFYTETAELQASWEQSRERLQGMEGEARDNIAKAEGASPLGESLEEALRLNDEVERIHLAALDAAAFREAVEKFQAAVASAEEMIEAVREAQRSAFKPPPRPSPGPAPAPAPGREPGREPRLGMHSLPDVGVIRVRVQKARDLPSRRRSILSMPVFLSNELVFAAVRVGDCEECTETVQRKSPIWNSREFSFPARVQHEHLEIDVRSAKRNAKDARPDQQGSIALPIRSLPRNEWLSRRERLSCGGGVLEFEVRFDTYEQRSLVGDAPDLTEMARVASLLVAELEGFNQRIAMDVSFEGQAVEPVGLTYAKQLQEGLTTLSSRPS